jgi:diguanylate cyclase (GGDEF)-like protein/PAS domain S-box-containing protein
MENVRAALAMTSDLILFVRNRDLSIVEANEVACSILRYSRSELLTLSLSQIVPREGFDAIALAILDTHEALSKMTPKSLSLARRGGSKVPIEARFCQFRGPNQGLFVLVGRDLTDRQRLERLLASPAHRDPLTGLSTRQLLNARLRIDLARVRQNTARLALFFIDLDSFKQVNDTWGHVIGDRVLSAVARRLVRCLRIDDVAIRYGGDEFVAVVYSIGERRDAVQIAKNISQAIQRPMKVGGVKLRVTASVGITIADRNGRTPLDLLRRADQGMYAAKALGRNGQCVLN